MERYRMAAAKQGDSDDLIYATPAAAPETFVVYVHEDGMHDKIDVVAWGILEDGVAVPITLCGVWDGTTNRNKFVRFPGGICADFDQTWPNLDAALRAVRGER